VLIAGAKRRLVLYPTSAAKLLDYERVRFASKAQKLRIQPTSPMRVVGLTATNEVIGTPSPESPNFERVPGAWELAMPMSHVIFGTAFFRVRGNDDMHLHLQARTLELK
jgi:hypothetical protein